MESIMFAEKLSFIQRVEIGLNILNHIFIGFVAINLTWACFRSSATNSAIHGWLCAIGYQLLMAEAIMCFYSANYSLSIYSRQAKTTIHWVLQVVGGIMAIAGTFVKYFHKEVHFKSIHAITGLIATILVCFGLLSGLGALYSQTLRNFLTPVRNKSLHIVVGLFTFVIGMVSLYYGYDTGFFSRRVDRDFAKLLKVITALIIILTVIGPIRSLCRHFMSIRGSY